MFFCESREISKNTLFTEHLWETAPGYRNVTLTWNGLKYFPAFLAMNTKIVDSIEIKLDPGTKWVKFLHSES